MVFSAGSEGIGVAIAWVVNGNAISGNAVAPEPGVGYCTVSMIGKYKNRRMTGSYSPTYGCGSGTGHFNLWHKCYFKDTGSAAIGPETGVKPC